MLWGLSYLVWLGIVVCGLLGALLLIYRWIRGWREREEAIATILEGLHSHKRLTIAEMLSHKLVRDEELARRALKYLHRNGLVRDALSFGVRRFDRIESFSLTYRGEQRTARLISEKPPRS